MTVRTWHSKGVKKLCELHVKQGQGLPGTYVCAKIFLLSPFVVSPVEYSGSGDAAWLGIWAVMAAELCTNKHLALLRSGI